VLAKSPWRKCILINFPSPKSKASNEASSDVGEGFSPKLAPSQGFHLDSTYLHAKQETSRCPLHLSVGVRFGESDEKIRTDESQVATASLLQCGCQAKQRIGLRIQLLVCETAATRCSPLSCTQQADSNYIRFSYKHSADEHWNRGWKTTEH